MNTGIAMSEDARVGEDVLRIAALAAAMRVIYTDNELRLRQRSLSVSCPPRPESEIQFTGRVPFGFVFTEGQEATFRVPSGHRFVIENVIVSCDDEHGKAEVHMVTRSRRMFQHLSLESSTNATAPILVHGSTDNTLMFSNRLAGSSSTVPPDTYVQLWGFLEPTEDATSA
jgi:hypothetical protein